LRDSDSRLERGLSCTCRHEKACGSFGHVYPVFIITFDPKPFITVPHTSAHRPVTCRGQVMPCAGGWGGGGCDGGGGGDFVICTYPSTCVSLLYSQMASRLSKPLSCSRSQIFPMMYAHNKQVNSIYQNRMPTRCNLAKVRWTTNLTQGTYHVITTVNVFHQKRLIMQCRRNTGQSTIMNWRKEPTSTIYILSPRIPPNLSKGEEAHPHEDLPQIYLVYQYVCQTPGF
jgi:hypothetical protein